MPHRLYPQVAARARHHCEYCLAPEQISRDRFQVEHIRPRARGGSDDLTNLALACSACNRWKSRVTHALDDESRTIVPLFNPRHDTWAEHFSFRFVDDALLIDGLTPTGRATVRQLAMNDDHACRARLLWVIDGRYPP
jgi:5-methylcytosine-specific restriction endonuclease McrA